MVLDSFIKASPDFSEKLLKEIHTPWLTHPGLLMAIKYSATLPVIDADIGNAEHNQHLAVEDKTIEQIRRDTNNFCKVQLIFYWEIQLFILRKPRNKTDDHLIWTKFKKLG